MIGVIGQDTRGPGPNTIFQKISVKAQLVGPPAPGARHWSAHSPSLRFPTTNSVSVVPHTLYKEFLCF